MRAKSRRTKRSLRAGQRFYRDSTSGRRYSRKIAAADFSSSPSGCAPEGVQFVKDAVLDPDAVDKTSESTMFDEVPT